MTSIPSNIAYLRYKADTQAFAAWIRDTSNALEPKALEQSSKGKKKKKKAIFKTSGQPASGPSNVAKYILPFDEFIPRAQRIAQCSKTLITMPEEVHTAARRMIAARQRRTSYYQSKQIQDERSNESHCAFTELMEEVLQTLQPCLVKKPATSQDSGTHSTPTALSHPNFFDGLMNHGPTKLGTLQSQMEQAVPTKDPTISSTALPTRPSNGGSGAGLSSATLTQEVDQIEDEKDFALFCLLEYLESLQAFIEKTWVDYRSRQIDCMSAAIITNTAYEFARHAAEDLSRTYEQFADYESIICFYSPLAKRVPTKSQCSETSSQSIQREKFESIFSASFHFLKDFCNIKLQNGGKARTRSRKNRRKDDLALKPPSESYSDKAGSKLGLPESMLSQMFVLLELSQNKASDLVEDELLKCLRSLSITKSISLPLVFALHMTIKIQKILGDQVHYPFMDLLATGQRMKRSIKECLREMYNFPVEWWSPSRSQAMIDVVKTINRWIWDDDQWERDNISQYSGPIFFLLPCHPVLTGLIPFRYAGRARKAGLRLHRETRFSIECAHLYNAAHKENVSNTSWPNMDYLLELHGAEMFLGEPPSDAASYSKQKDLVDGISIRSFAAENRSTFYDRSPKYNPDGPAGFKGDDPLIRLLAARYVDGQEAEGFKSEVLEAPLREFMNKRIKKAQAVGVTKQKPYHKNKRLDPYEMLESLRVYLAEDCRCLRFDYFAMHTSCIKVLESIWNVNEDVLFNYYKAPRVPKGPQHWLPPTGLFFTGLEFDATTHGTIHRILFRGVGRAIDIIVEKQGNVPETRRYDVGWVTAEKGPSGQDALLQALEKQQARSSSGGES